MSRNGDVEEEIAATLRNRTDPFLVACRGFSFITSLAAILCIAVNVLSAVRSFKHASDIFDGIFRCYAVIIAAFVVLAETEWSFILKFSKVLEYWAARGMLQIFVAVMTRAFPDYIGDRKNLFLLQSIASYLLLACGVVYVFSVRSLKRNNLLRYLYLRKVFYCQADLGILCIGFLKRARQKQEITREQAAKDLEELERRREELEQLLLDPRV
ncbi:unnamed protein product [Sphenostylis stenocarpa]|uniref:Golgi apparatus membrane protein TVP15 n=1 Tax=Sphenostylis stenocarpa TaxID=92480 RepID=A0AA86S5N3_9FABA|nr:unnamed protein product [Sphenostylis stenocarpa]